MPNQARPRLRMLFSSLLFTVTVATGMLAVVATGFAPFRETVPAADRLMELAAWVYLIAGLLLAAWLLLDLRRNWILFGLWLAALATLLVASPPLRTVGGIGWGLGCCALVSALVMAANWATGHRAV